MDKDCAAMLKELKQQIEAGCQENALALSILSVFAWRIMILAFCRSILTAINFGRPFIFMALIEFIQDGNANQSWIDIKQGVFLSLAFIGCLLADLLIDEHLKQRIARNGESAKNMMTTLIYKKHFRFSEATSKDFN